MQKITAVLMALALALSLFACGGEPVQDETPESDIQQGTVILPKPQEDNEGGDSRGVSLRTGSAATKTGGHQEAGRT